MAREKTPPAPPQRPIREGYDTVTPPIPPGTGYPPAAPPTPPAPRPAPPPASPPKKS